jgi:hypothetical protein
LAFITTLIGGLKLMRNIEGLTKEAEKIGDEDAVKCDNMI